MNYSIRRTLGLTLAVTILPLPLAGQKLRRSVAAADLVALATSTRVIPTKHHILHRMRVEEILRGPKKLAKATTFTVVETKRLSSHNRPTPARKMLVCLHDFAQGAQQARLPGNFAPYFKMSGHPGSAVTLDTDARKDPRLEFARVLIASQAGASPRQVTQRLFTIAVHGDARIRIEAAQTLAERTVLAGYLTRLHLSTLLGRATGELTDIPYKIALATICVERREPAVIPTLCVSVEHLGDPTFLKALGRFAKFLHKEQAAEALMPHLQRAKGKTRERMIYALGATSTESALHRLLKMRESGQDRAAVEKALRVHGSSRALKALKGEPARGAGPGR